MIVRAFARCWAPAGEREIRSCPFTSHSLILLRRLIPSGFRFMEIVRRRLRERGYSRRTEEAYVRWIRHYIIFHGRRHPRELAEPEVAGFLSSLAVEQRVSASTQNQALAALTFLYDGVLDRPLTRIEGMTPARRSQYVPVVLSESEIRTILTRMPMPARLSASLMYGSGLRLMECLALRVKDIDRERREITVRGGKGGKDRRTPLAEASLSMLDDVLAARGRRFQEDAAGCAATPRSFTACTSPGGSHGRDRRVAVAKVSERGSRVALAEVA